MTSSVAGLRSSSKALPKAKLAPKKSWSPFRGLLPIWSTTASESRWNHYIWAVRSANQWDALKTSMPAAGLGQQNGPNSPQHHLTTHCITNTSRVELIGLRSFVSFAILTWLLANRLSLLQAFGQLFAGKTFPQPAGGRKYFPRVHWILKQGVLCNRNK